MSEWMLFNAKWVNECCLMPNEWMNVVQGQMREWMLFNTKCWTTFILSFGLEQHSFSHLALNNIHSLIWHWTTITHSFGNEQHSFSHLALNNIHFNEWIMVVQCQMTKWMLFNAKWENESCLMPNEWMNAV
jgi:hypothetical protein